MIVTKDTTPATASERKANWYTQIVNVPDYHLVTGRRDAAREYEPQQMLSACPVNTEYEH